MVKKMSQCAADVLQNVEDTFSCLDLPKTFPSTTTKSRTRGQSTKFGGSLEFYPVLSFFP